MPFAHHQLLIGQAMKNLGWKLVMEDADPHPQWVKFSKVGDKIAEYNDGVWKQNLADILDELGLPHV